MIDMNAMMLFVKVVENKSFSQAARREGVPISSISRKVAALEKTLGVRLLERSTRHLRLTELGQDYYDLCRRGLEEFEAANLLISNQQTEVSGILRLSAPPNLSEVIVEPLVSGFQALYPNVMMRVLITDRQTHLIQEGVDLALRVGTPADDSLIARPLLTYRHLLIASPTYLKQHGHPRHPRELNHHKLIAFGQWFREKPWRLSKADQHESVDAQGRFAINDYSGVKNAVLRGQGIGEIPAILCAKALNEGRLVEVMPSWRFETITLSAVYSQRRNLSRVVRLFKDYCLENIEALAPHTGL